MNIVPLLALVLFSASTRFTNAEEPRQAQQIPAEEYQVLCNYIEDIEAKTEADCVQTDWATLKAQDPAAYLNKLESSRKRKAEVQQAFDFLKAPATTGTPDPAGQDQPNPAKLQPPINERTFLVWIGTEATDIKAVYAHWLESQSQELEQERQHTEDPERRKKLDAALAANQTRIRGLQKIKDPGQLGCFMGEACGTKSDLADPAAQTMHGTAGGAWTAADYKRANEEETGRGVRIPGGKIDRGVPSFSLIASEVVDNSPLGPLRGNAGDKQKTIIGTVATVALATTGAFLLFGGLGGKFLEEKFPNIRRNMGLAVVATGAAIAVGVTLYEFAPALLSSPPVVEGTRKTIESAESPRGQRAIERVTQGVGRLGQMVSRPFQRYLSSEAGAINAKAGIVWNHIKPTQPNWPNTQLPRSFEVSVRAGRFWVHPNATEHMFDVLGRVKAPEQMSYRPPLQSQVLLDSFRSALERATLRGIPYNQPIRVDRWEFIIRQEGQTGPLPTVVHAQYYH